MQDVRCGKAKPHDSHPYKKRTTKTCSGLMVCGEVVHAPHNYEAVEEVWCGGVCDCGLGRGLHGPGAHK